MARSQQHRAPSSSISSPFPRRNLRRPAATTTAAPNSHTLLPSPVLSNHRPVLVPLQPNLRRLPSRILLAQKDNNLSQPMQDSSHVITVGSKRKRVVTSNENAHTHGRSIRGSGRLKRLRSDGSSSTTKYHRLSTSEESSSQASEMDVDTPAQLSASDDSDIDQELEQDSEDQEEGNDEDDSTDDHLIHSAPRNQLNRLRKNDLVRLYDLAGLIQNADTLTKSDIVEAILNARDDFASVPPSSPLGRADGASSEYSSDDGNVAGDEETDCAGTRRGPHTTPLKRRVTLNDLGNSTTRAPKARNTSMSNLLGRGEIPLKRKASARSETDNAEPVTSRRRTSTRTSPIIAATRTITESPPAHRLRSRNASCSIPNSCTPTSSGTSKGKGKGKSKQVEFSEAVEIRVKSPSKRSAKGKEHARHEESDLTELEDLEKMSRGQPSPRRLRSKDREIEKPKGKGRADPDATPIANSKRRKQIRSTDIDKQIGDNEVRVIPMRKAKGKIGNLKESDTEQEETEEEHDELENNENVQADVDEAEQEEEEVDELVSSASTTPPPESKGRCTPLRRRLRSRGTQNKTAYEEDVENEGDDEEEDEENEEAEEDEEAAEDQAEQEDGEQEDGTEEEAGDEDDEATIAVEPRRLRNGKIVGEEDADMEVDEDIGEENEEDEEAEEEAVEEGADADSIDIDGEGETDEDEVMEDDVDLTIATAKTLIRLRRDDLVRLCETRDLVPAGSKPTKPQLAEALLQWRDRQTNDFSSPSSSGTIRPSSNRRRRRTKHHSSSTNTALPVLLRSEQIHTDEPRTPIPGKEKDKENEELELDLESLGLEDREIPLEKLTKLEKIGSGGFKDVYIGKFKGRKIAISEFRGQLSAMDIKELKLLGAFNHPNIVRFLGVSVPENTKDIPVMIVSELCSNGDLFDYVRNVNAPSLHKVLQMALDIAHGLEYLHTRKPSIIHRDCKSSNILITAKGTAKIADFGLAKVKQSTRSMVRSLVGTVNWQAPELWHAHPKYNHKVDVFSCAMVYWEMLQWHLPNKKFPWEGMNEHAIYDIVGSKRQRPSITGLRKQWCPEIVDLIEHMWAHEHQDRPTISEVVQAVQELLAKY